MQYLFMSVRLSVYPFVSVNLSLYPPVIFDRKIMRSHCCIFAPPRLLLLRNGPLLVIII
jgi:hypothetical protein